VKKQKLVNSAEKNNSAHKCLQTVSEISRSRYLGPVVAEIEHGVFEDERVDWCGWLTTAYSPAHHWIHFVRVRCCSVQYKTRILKKRQAHWPSIINIMLY